MLYSYFIYAGILKSKVTAGWAGILQYQPGYIVPRLDYYSPGPEYL
jgi:hypothetical protein